MTLELREAQHHPGTDGSGDDCYQPSPNHPCMTSDSNDKENAADGCPEEHEQVLSTRCFHSQGEEMRNALRAASKPNGRTTTISASASRPRKLISSAVADSAKS